MSLSGKNISFSLNCKNERNLLLSSLLFHHSVNFYFTVESAPSLNSSLGQFLFYRWVSTVTQLIVRIFSYVIIICIFIKFINGNKWQILLYFLSLFLQKPPEFLYPKIAIKMHSFFLCSFLLHTFLKIYCIYSVLHENRIKLYTFILHNHKSLLISKGYG